MLEASGLIHVGSKKGGAQLVLGVERERVTRQDSTDGPERLPLDLLILREVLTNGIRFRTGRDVRIANRSCTDPSGGADIPLQQHRRHSEHVRDVVEPVG